MARRPGSRRGATTASSTRCCRSGARRRRRTARADGLAFRVDSSNADTKRGLIRDEILPLLRRLHPGADENLLRALDTRATLPPALAELLASPAGSKRVDLGGGLQAVREYERLWLERGPVDLAGEIQWGDWTIRSELEGLRVRGWRPGDRLAGRRREDSGRVRRREGAALGARGVAARRARRRGRGRARHRRASGGAKLSATELERAVTEILIEEDALQRRIAELGAEISADYEGRDLLLVGVLKGAVFFLADLMRHLTVPCEIDFMAISSYGASTDSSGVVRILKDLDINIEGRHVLVVEDIIDSGLTLSYLVRNLEAREPASLEVCALLTKPERREIDVPVRYTGFEIPNRFVIGYGLDFAERYRNLPYVGVLDESLVLGRRVAGGPRNPLTGMTLVPSAGRSRESLLP